MLINAEIHPNAEDKRLPACASPVPFPSHSFRNALERAVVVGDIACRVEVDAGPDCILVEMESAQKLPLDIGHRSWFVATCALGVEWRYE